MWFCGEAYAKEKRWINSALQSSLQVYHSITRTFQKSRTSTRRKAKQSSTKKTQGSHDKSIVKDRTWTLKEMYDFNRKEGFHLIVIHNKVYNVYSWLQSHPGGKEVLEKYLGKDASEAYEGNTWEGHHHSIQAREMLKKYYCGIFKS